MSESIAKLYSTPPRPLSQLSELSIPSAEKGTITLPPVYYTYVIVQVSKLDELADCKAKEKLKSIKYIGETSMAPSERLKNHRRELFADNPEDYSMVIYSALPNNTCISNNKSRCSSGNTPILEGHSRENFHYSNVNQRST
jgi:hypothetical protein